MVVASLDPARNAARRRKAEEPGRTRRVIGVPTDLNDAAAVEALFKTTLAEFGRLDILVNNATNISQGSFFTMDRGELGSGVRRQVARRGALHPPRGAADARAQMGPHRQRLRRRRLDAAARRHRDRRQQCGGANLTVALANELGKDGILVNAIVPTAVRTDRHDKNIRDTMAKTGQSEAEVLKPRVAKIPVGRMGTAEEIANVVVFLASERASFVNGSAWAVDGGISARLVTGASVGEIYAKKADA